MSSLPIRSNYGPYILGLFIFSSLLFIGGFAGILGIVNENKATLSRKQRSDFFWIGGSIMFIDLIFIVWFSISYYKLYNYEKSRYATISNITSYLSSTLNESTIKTQIANLANQNLASGGITGEKVPNVTNLIN